MSILRVRDDKGNVQEILALRGEPGKDYVLTQEDKQEIADMIDGTIESYDATPENILEVIANAKPNTTVNLAAGNYPLLTLTNEIKHGKAINGDTNPVATKFPENLTIKGAEGAIVAGISLTSGSTNSSSSNTKTSYIWRTDVTHTILSKGLTLKNITLSNSISLRNSCIEDLTIDNCTITSGNIIIGPNRFRDQYAKDGGSTPNRYALQRTYAKNILIKNCEINAPLNSDDYTKCGIYVDSCEDVVISSNTIGVQGQAAGTGGTNGIKVVSMDTTTRTTGIVRIGQNTIWNTSSNCILVSKLKNATISIVKNFLHNSGAKSSEYIKLSECLGSTYTLKRLSNGDGRNEYNGNQIDVAGPKGITVEDMVSYTTSTKFSEHTENKKNPHGVTAAQIGIDVDNLQLKNITYQATPDTLTTIIANAQANSTIQLAAGTYSLLSLVGNKSYPENLRIIGAADNGSIINGISITSGIQMQDIYKQAASGDLNGYRISDITKAIMPKGLCLEGIYFGKPFCVRNCDISDITVKNCTFGPGANIQLVPNSSKDDHGDDGSSRLGTVRNFATRYAHNTTISRCTFMDCYPLEGAKTTYGKHAVYASTIDGITINNCTVHKAAHNGFQITGTSGSAYNAKSKGRIIITNNTIESTISRSIRLSTMENAYLCVEANMLYDANKEGEELSNTEVIKASNLDASVQTRWDLNFYNDTAISVGNNITEEKPITNYDVTQKNNWVVRTIGNCKECWGSFSDTVVSGGNSMVVNLPFSLSSFYNLQATLSESNGLTIREIHPYDTNSVIIWFKNVSTDIVPTVNVYCMTCDV